MPVLMLKSWDDGPWIDLFADLMPELDVRAHPDIGDPAEIDYAYVFRPPAGLLASLPNLKGIFSVGAGVDHILADPDVPAGVPISRVVDPDMAMRMTEFCVFAVLYYHRRWPEIAAITQRRAWEVPLTPAARDRRVGVMGLGELGGASARALTTLGFDVAGWARTPKALDGVTVYAGAEGFAPFLARSEILLNLLPLTAETTGILNARTFAGLPRGAKIINVARGGHLAEGDLIPALDSGQLDGAFLDVFAAEPLPDDHPFWTHPKVTISPHLASIADRKVRAGLVVDGIRRLERGERPLHCIDPARGY